MSVRSTLLLVLAVFISFVSSPSYSGDIISCDSFESCPEADTSALEARIAALEALLAGATRGLDPGTSKDTLTFGNSISSDAVKVRELSATEKEGTSLVCFNGAGELLPCADGVEPPPPVDPYLGSWTGRMIYDRRSAGTCYDADVHFTVISAAESWHRIRPITVIRDAGGLDTDSNGEELYLESGVASGTLLLFLDEVNELTTYTIHFGTNGTAQGYWNLDDNTCYGEWTFTKD